MKVKQHSFGLSASNILKNIVDLEVENKVNLNIKKTWMTAEQTECFC